LEDRALGVLDVDHVVTVSEPDRSPARLTELPRALARRLAPRHGTLDPVSGWRAFSSDGHDVRWTTWDGDHEEHLTLRWENEGWTACGAVGRERVQYVLTLGTTGQGARET